MGLGVPVVGFGVPVMGLGVPVMGLGVPVVGFGVPVMGLGVPVVGFGVPVMGLGVPVMGLGVPVIGCEVAVMGLGVPVMGLVASQEDAHHREFLAYIYSSLQILNFSIHIARHAPVKFTRELLWSFLEYLLYPAYSTSLIVLYPDFAAQMDSIHARLEAGQPASPSPRAMARKTARLIFWFFFMETILHFLRINAIFNSHPSLIYGMSNYEIVSIAYVAGLLFHLKYTLIFGLPAFFAELDGLAPPRPPICISRVSKYSCMWRYFDRGLYAFLKNQVYRPLMGSAKLRSNDGGKRLAAMLPVFLFVLAWHSVAWNYVNWVLLSALGMCIERLASDHLATAKWYVSLQARLSSACLWRLQSVMMLAVVAPGILGTFFFLSAQLRHNSEIGAYIFEQGLMRGAWQLLTGQWAMAGPGWVLAHLLLMGVAFNSVCLDLERRLD